MAYGQLTSVGSNTSSVADITNITNSITGAITPLLTVGLQAYTATQRAKLQDSALKAQAQMVTAQTQAQAQTQMLQMQLAQQQSGLSTTAIVVLAMGSVAFLGLILILRR
jgi:uncharacterized membrane protein YgdD (TMEM256/DUF423 family)